MSDIRYFLDFSKKEQEYILDTYQNLPRSRVVDAFYYTTQKGTVDRRIKGLVDPGDTFGHRIV